ncbi:MAG TPA: YncE family protein [Blastocatellia bacterium]|nr:YncE family protein [Blastocatellia bacterium]
MKPQIAPVRTLALLVLFPLLLAASYSLTKLSPSATAQGVSPAGALTELSIDDGTASCATGPPEGLRGRPGFGWVNKLTPTTYPATLRKITIGFNRSGAPDPDVKPDALFTVVVFKDPEMNGPANNQQPDVAFTGRVRGRTDAIMTFNLVTGVTIEQGSFVIGVIDEVGNDMEFPALFDVPGRSNPPGSESFVTFNGGALWRPFREVLSPDSQCGAGSFLIRATVEANPVDVLSVTNTIKDPLAVEPWGVAVNAASNGEVFVTNYVSDNVTIIKRSDNSIQNLPVGDGPGGAPDGPFGVVRQQLDATTYVTLFGSNTIPTKEFPIDYSTVGDGRVAVLTKASANAPFVVSATINVNKGPRFPSIASANGLKVYVPCGGADTVDIINTSTNLKVGQVAVGDDPSSCTTSLTGSKIYVTNFGDGTISVIDTKTETKIKDIQLPPIPQPVGSNPSRPINPWRGALSPANGNLYVTYWGAEGNAAPNGVIAEIDTCTDEFLRFIIDDTTAGTPAGSAGASGIPAPVAPLARDTASGLTPGAGGGGGGPFGIASLASQFAVGPFIVNEPLMFFTNDGKGFIGAFDSRIDQVVSAPPVSVATCPKPRHLALVRDASINRVIAYVACGQPDNSVLVVSAPITTLQSDLPSSIEINSITATDSLQIRGKGLTANIHVEILSAGSTGCLTFERAAKIKKMGKKFLLKGPLSDGRRLSDVIGQGSSVILRITLPDGTTRLIFLSPVASP